jgi:hypothetical protein
MTTTNTLFSGGQGVAVPTGYVGTIITATAASNSATLNTGGTALTVVSLAFPVGTWFMSASAAFSTTSNVTSINYLGLQFTSGTTFDTTASADFWSQMSMTGTQINNGDCLIGLKSVFTVSSATTYNLLARASYSGGAIVVRGGSIVPAVINAVRIA